MIPTPWGTADKFTKGVTGERARAQLVAALIAPALFGPLFPLASGAIPWIYFNHRGEILKIATETGQLIADETSANWKAIQDVWNQYIKRKEVGQQVMDAIKTAADRARSSGIPIPQLPDPPEWMMNLFTDRRAGGLQSVAMSVCNMRIVLMIAMLSIMFILIIYMIHRRADYMHYHGHGRRMHRAYRT